MQPLTLATERLDLRPLRSEDAEACHLACQDPEIQRWTTVPSPYRREHAEDFVGRICPEGRRTDTEYVFGAFTRDGGELTGVMGVARVPDTRSVSGLAEIGYWTVRQHRGHGYTAEAARAVGRWSFVSMGVERLVWVAEVGNTASRRVAEKAGFTMEGLLRAHLLNKDVRRDAWIGSLLPSDLGLGVGRAYLPARQDA